MKDRFLAFKIKSEIFESEQRLRIRYSVMLKCLDSSYAFMLLLSKCQFIRFINYAERDRVSIDDI